MHVSSESLSFDDESHLVVYFWLVAQGKNVALNKPAFASSNQVNDDGKSFHAFNAVDGNKHTR